MKFLNEGFDHVEFAVHSIDTHEKMWTRFGFEKIADVEVASKGARQAVMAQGSIRVLLTQYDGSPAAHAQPGYTFLKTHHDGICTLAVEVEDAAAAFNEVVGRGAKPAVSPQTFG